jgi:outer membrane protease
LEESRVTTKRFCSSLLLCAFVASGGSMPIKAAGAELPAKAYGASFYGGVGLINISAGEFVYDGNRNLSRLDWRSRGAFVFSGGVLVELPKDWTAKADLSFGIGGDGHMVDYDWLVPGQPDGPDDWSDRSISPDTRLDHYWSAALSLEKRVLSRANTDFSLGAGFKYTDLQWSAYGGSFIYTNVTFRDFVGDFPDGEKVITYRQKVPVGFLSVSAMHTSGAWTLSGALKGGLSFGIKDIDDHWLRGLRFYDNMKMAPAAGIDVNVSYAVSQKADLFLAASWDKVFKARGDETDVDTLTGAVDSFADTVGADLQTISLRVGAKVRF